MCVLWTVKNDYYQVFRSPRYVRFAVHTDWSVVIQNVDAYLKSRKKLCGNQYQTSLAVYSPRSSHRKRSIFGASNWKRKLFRSFVRSSAKSRTMPKLLLICHRILLPHSFSLHFNGHRAACTNMGSANSSRRCAQTCPPSEFRTMQQKIKGDNFITHTVNK